MRLALPRVLIPTNPRKPLLEETGMEQIVPTHIRSSRFATNNSSMCRTPRLYADLENWVCTDVKRFFSQTASNSTLRFGGFEAPSDFAIGRHWLRSGRWIPGQIRGLEPYV
jgi:hypothetical protein